MGLFGGTKVYVSSVAVNLGGDYEKVPNHLKSIIVGNILTGNNLGMAELLRTNYMRATGTKLRQFFRWAAVPGKYNSIGLPVAYYAGMDNVSPTSVYDAFVTAGIFPDDGGTQVYAEVGPANMYWWALEKQIEVGAGGFVPDGTPVWGWTYDEGTNTGTLTNLSGSYDFTPTGYDPEANYAYALRRKTTVTFEGGIRVVEHIWEVGIYKFGSGIAELDALTNDTAIPGYQFFPYVPIRRDNEFYSTTYNPVGYAQTQTAFRRIFGTDTDKIVEQLASNANIADMDHAYVLFGVGAQTRDRTCMEYLYRFFLLMRDAQYTTLTDLSDFRDREATYVSSVEAWETWDASGRVGDPPGMADFPTSKTSSLYVKNGFGGGQMNIEIVWRHISQETGTGLAKPGAKVGELWFDYPSALSGILRIFSDDIDNGTSASGGDTVQLYWQRTADTWTKLEIVGAVHRNFVYIDQAVETRLVDALNDSDETGFLVPLHKETTDDMGLIKLNQMTSSCMYLVINCFKIVKVSFLAGLLSVAFFIAAIVMIIVAPPIGILGTNASVGAAIGLSATAALVAGAVINAIAAIIITKIISIAAVAIFGDKLGAIIGAVVGFVAISVGTGLSNGMSMSEIWSSMGSASNLLRLTNAAGSGVSGYVQAAIKDLNQEMEAFTNKMDAEMKTVQDAYAANIGYDRGSFDPMGLTNTMLGNPMETSSQFLTRTTLTGSDIAEISLGMISRYTSLTLDTSLPG